LVSNNPLLLIAVLILASPFLIIAVILSVPCCPDFTTSANISARPVYLNQSVSGFHLTVYCTSYSPGTGISYLTLTNAGDGPTSVDRINLSYGGQTEMTSSGLLASCLIEPKSAEYVIIVHSGALAASKGESYAGWVAMTNGAEVNFSGKFR
jgi:hypothetical protein